MNVVIDKDAKARLWAFIKAVKVEVGGMGYAFLQDDGSLEWKDTFLIPQEVSSSEVDFEKTGGDQVAIERAIEDGVLDDPRFVWVSWHSHHTMKAFWSSTDDKRIAAMNAVGIKRMLSFVGCHDGEYEMRFDLFGVEAHDVNIGQVTIGKLEFEAEPKREPSEFEKTIAAEIEANVREKSFTTFSSKSLVGAAETARDSFYGFGQSDYMEERRIVQEIMEVSGYGKQDAEELVRELGLDQAEDLINEYLRTQEVSK